MNRWPIKTQAMKWPLWTPEPVKVTGARRWGCTSEGRVWLTGYRSAQGFGPELTRLYTSVGMGRGLALTGEGIRWSARFVEWSGSWTPRPFVASFAAQLLSTRFSINQLINRQLAVFVPNGMLTDWLCRRIGVNHEGRGRKPWRVTGLYVDGQRSPLRRREPVLGDYGMPSPHYGWGEPFEYLND